MNLFQKIQGRAPKSSKFDLSHERKFSLDMATLTPILCQDVLPGDNFKVNAEMLLRLQPLQSPMMHRVNSHIHYFFVPNRLLWSSWEDFITGGRTGESMPVLPYIQLDDVNKLSLGQGSLGDYLGLPNMPTGSITSSHFINALPFRAYQLIYNEYYRDQNVQLPVGVEKDSGSIDPTEFAAITQLRKRAWMKDYFTSCLPWPQRGPESSVFIENQVGYKDTGFVPVQPPFVPQTGAMSRTGSGGITVAGVEHLIENIDYVEGQITVNELRRSVRIQEWLEKNARGGARYVEQLMSHFGILPEDARLQRPEFLGGGKYPVVVSEVLNTASNDEEGEFYPLGEMGGHGISVGGRAGFKKRFTEHGYVIGLMSVMPLPAYQQGIPKHFLRRDKLEFPWPEFANLGEQEVLNKELYFDGTDGEDNNTFGYQSRYAECKYIPSTVHGDFRGNLDYWHMGRIFNSRPALNGSFIEGDPTKRVFAVEDEEVNSLLCQCYQKISAIRPLPYYGTPIL